MGIMTNKCPRCHVIFECKHDSNCWCSKYNLTENVREYLKINYVDCLCENCLKDIISEIR